MMSTIIAEETIEPEFAVWISNRVYYYIDRVIKHNMTNPSAIEGLLESIDLIQKHLSYRSMGLGYGITNPFMELGLSVHYNLKFSIDNQPYVNIYRIEINYEYFGLNNPLTIRENKQYNTMKNTRNRVRLTESQLHKVIKKSVKQVIKEMVVPMDSRGDMVEPEVNSKDWVPAPEIGRGWEKIENEDYFNDVIYRDSDYNEYSTDEYGHLIPLNESLTSSTSVADDVDKIVNKWAITFGSKQEAAQELVLYLKTRFIAPRGLASKSKNHVC